MVLNFIQNHMKYIYAAAFLLLYAFSIRAQAETVQKIGYVYTDTVLYSLPQTVLKRKELEVYSKQLQSSLERKQQYFQQQVAIYQEYLKVPENVVPKVKAEKEQALQKLQRELQTEQAEAQKKLNDKEKRLFDPVSQKIRTAVTEYAQAEQYTFIFPGKTFYVTPQMDNCTDQIMTKLGGTKENIQKIIAATQRLQQQNSNR